MRTSSKLTVHVCLGLLLLSAPALAVLKDTTAGPADADAVDNDTSWKDEPVCSKLPNPLNDGYEAFSQKARELYPACADTVAVRCDPRNRLDCPQASPVGADAIGEKPHDTPNPAPETCVQAQQAPKGDASGAALAKISSAAVALDDTGLQAKHRLAQVTLEAFDQAEQKRRHDLDETLRVFEDEGISPEMNGADVKKAVTTFSFHINRAAAKIGDPDEAENTARFIGEQFQEAANYKSKTKPESNGFLSLLGDAAFPDAEKRGFAPYDKTKGVKEAAAKSAGQESLERSRFEYVRDIAYAEDDHRSYPGDLTPYHAKMLLLFHLRNKVLDKYRAQFPGDEHKAASEATKVLNRLASKLWLKHTVGENPNRAWADMIPHDGFYLGANTREIRNFAATPLDAAGSSPATGSSYDCSSFFQQNLRKAGFETLASKGRFSSARIRYGGLSAAGDVTRLTADAARAIAPGDVIVEQVKGDFGHVLTAVGYEGDPPILVLVDAAGGYSRGVIRHQQGLFADFPRDCSAGKGGANFLLAGDSKTSYYKFTLRKGPQ